MSFFSVSNLSASYGSIPVLHPLSFDLQQGCMMGVLGANGSGKTTLLKSICGILPHKGVCTLEGTVLERLSPKELAARCSYIPQRSGISIDISVLDVVLMGCNPRLKLLERPDHSMKRAAMQALSLTGLSGKEHLNYQHLSEGQKQLCILARTLVSGGQLFLMDEPESALDLHFRFAMLCLLRRQIECQKRAAIVTLHDPSLALNTCHRLLVLSEGQAAAILSPSSDSLETMEHWLSSIYGPVCLRRVRDHKGQTHLVMLKEREEE